MKKVYSFVNLCLTLKSIEDIHQKYIKLFTLVGTKEKILTELSNENMQLKSRLSALQKDYDKTYAENERFLRKYNNVDISDLYSKFRIYQTKWEYLQRRKDQEEKNAKRYKKKLDQFKFSLVAGDYIKESSKGKQRNRMFKRLKEIQEKEHNSQNHSERSLVSVASSTKSLDHPEKKRPRKNTEQTLAIRRKLKMLFMNIE